MLAPVNLVARQVPSSRHDVYAADLQDQEEVDDRARDRYQRLFWEPVGESEVNFFSLLLPLRCGIFSTIRMRSNSLLFS